MAHRQVSPRIIDQFLKSVVRVSEFALQRTAAHMELFCHNVFGHFAGTQLIKQACLTTRNYIALVQVCQPIRENMIQSGSQLPIRCR